MANNKNDNIIITIEIPVFIFHFKTITALINKYVAEQSDISARVGKSYRMLKVNLIRVASGQDIKAPFPDTNIFTAAVGKARMDGSY